MFKNMFKSKDTLKKELLEEIKEEQRQQEEKEQQLKQQAYEEEQRLKQVEEEARREAEEDFKKSNQPWVDVKNIVVDPESDKGVKIELDWNDAFIDYLKQNGFTGANDDQIIQKYIGLMYKQLLDDMKAEDTSIYE